MNDDIQGELRAFVADLARVPADTLESDTPLFGSGIIDSLNLLDLVGFVEKRWDLRVGAGDLTLDNWQTLGSIETYVTRRKTA